MAQITSLFPDYCCLTGFVYMTTMLANNGRIVTTLTTTIKKLLLSTEETKVSNTYLVTRLQVKVTAFHFCRYLAVQC